MIRETLALIVFFFMGAATPSVADEITQAEMPTSQCGGVLTQGGLVICRGAPGTQFTVAGQSLLADATGSAQFGLGRDAPSVIGWSTSKGEFGDLPIAPRHDKGRPHQRRDIFKRIAGSGNNICIFASLYGTGNVSQIHQVCRIDSGGD